MSTLIREKNLPGTPVNGGRFAGVIRPVSATALRARAGFDSFVGHLAPTDGENLPPVEDPRPGMRRDTDASGYPRFQGTISIDHLVTSQSAVVGTAESGRVSDTPDLAIELCLRDGDDAHFDIVDGHHRLVAALRRGETTVPVVIYDYVDDEPYDGDLFDFAAARIALS